MLIRMNVRNGLTLTLPEVSLPVEVIRRPRKTVGIRVRFDSIELVANPCLSLHMLERLLKEQSDWITKHWQQAREQHALVEQCLNTVYIAGVALTIVTLPGVRILAQWVDGQIGVSGVLANKGTLFKQAMAQLLQREAAVRFAPRFIAMSQLVDRQPAALQISSARTRWGSCTTAGVVRVNWRLVQAPLSVLDYVLAHELAHLSHMNHSVHFWRETARLFPAWRAARQWLQQRGHTLFTFG